VCSRENAFSASPTNKEKSLSVLAIKDCSLIKLISCAVSAYEDANSEYRFACIQLSNDAAIAIKVSVHHTGELRKLIRTTAAMTAAQLVATSREKNTLDVFLLNEDFFAYQSN
jgi:hypothetical protein